MILKENEMRNILIILLSLNSFLSRAEVCVGISNPVNDQLEISYTSDINYNTPPFNFWESQLFTLSWDQSVGSNVISSLVNISEFTFVEDGSPVLDGGKYYQKISYTGSTKTVNLSTGVSVTVLTINLVANTEATFEIIPFPPASVPGGNLTVNNSINGNVADTDYSIGCPASVMIILPVELALFNASPRNATDAYLNWTTASEINSSKFEVERSEDGQNWEMIGTVAAAGHSLNERNYDLIDHQVFNPSEGFNTTFYYRLKMVDMDETFEYSIIREVSFKNDGYFIVGEVFPNPAGVERSTVQLPIVAIDNTKIDIEIYDLQSRLVSISSQQLVSGNNSLSIDISMLSSGLYQLRIKTELNQSYVKKLVVQ